MSSSPLFQPLTLPNGSRLPNRLVKAAMEEGLAGRGQLPGPEFERLYRRWAAGGVGLILTGNVMVDPAALTGPGGVVLDEHAPLEGFRAWAAAARSGGAQAWMQINHPGRQVFAAMGEEALSASAVALDLGKHSSMFGQPRAMSEAEIAAVIQRFATTARRAAEAGFDGVQIHAAHGYLLNQFLSPLSNRREDRWGGSLANRARLLVEVVRAVKAVVPAGFGVGVKLNSADFQRGGFSEADARVVVELLNGEGLDLLELSGGSYESPAMQGRTADGRTLAREAYFLEFARELASVASMPLMTTGGISRPAVAEAVLAGGVALVGLGTALAMAPELPRRWRAGEAAVAPRPQVGWKDKAMASLATMALVRRQLQRMAAGKSPQAQASPLWALLTDQLRAKRLTRRYKGWRLARA
ncbi:NADH:flavin oxidoreductase/NADH oxidase family protein [Roseateles saccharophilus]|uniref:2,4-dienoyl-CoA reductase-like NADH-dependent reductase (Old Yellow Enzyme family) n=1 Tax=Roseateles saccharophilus TaxID=304 RepID=A0A4R3VIB8_ROSSA|nr:NADH:flavin oxidoreductase/NADH oxidase family protein [Roseateles saccharophilus]MDG0832777.1 NADH:flavin oxidoreductase/NADH oxidase family protein [Roseateles saccharophilus]TCV03863.1 2,4-dienoyl-CoA reductase-like NADH-dependent reductase (Old Yellow Enzyme family) [Roseateles saccharophilus]